MQPIPSLGQSSDEIIKNALNYNTGGFLLKFHVVGEGEWNFDSLLGKYIKLGWRGNIPFSERVENGLFDEWLAGQVKKGFVSIFVQAPGRNPWFKKEIHRATGKGLTN